MNRTYCIVGNFWGRKLSWISQFCGYSRNFSPRNLGTWCSLVRHKQAIRKKFSPRKSYFSPIRASFLPPKFSTMWYGGESLETKPNKSREDRTVYKTASKYKWLYLTAIYNWWDVSSATWSQLPRQKMLLSGLQASHKVLLSHPCQKICVALHSIIFCVHPIPVAKHASIK